MGRALHERRGTLVIQMTIEDALSRRDEGIQRAAEHAGIRWQRLARGFLLEFLSRPIGTFLAEDVRCFAEIRGLESPPDGRAWGAVLQSAAREKLIEKAGYGAARSSNLSPKVLWRARA
jgi:hypothetical protein